MSNSITLSIRRDGRIVSGRADKHAAMFGSSARLLRGDADAFEALFGKASSDVKDLRWVDGIQDRPLPPQSRGIVCIDFDVKRVHSHQGHGELGGIPPDVTKDTLHNWNRSGGEPSIFDGNGLVLDAFVAGFLLMDGEPMVCVAKDRRSALGQLLGALEDVRGYDLFRKARIVPVGWRVEPWEEQEGVQGLLNMAKALAADGWPIEVECLEGWQTYCRSQAGSAGKESAFFGEWAQSLRESHELSMASKGAALARSPKIRI